MSGSEAEGGACSDCGRTFEADDLIPCECGGSLCEACFDRIHEQHGLPGSSDADLSTASDRW